MIRIWHRLKICSIPFGPDDRIQLINNRGQYREMLTERDELKERYDSKSAEFSDLVHEFNEWENRLMKGKVKGDEAKASFIQYQKACAENG